MTAAVAIAEILVVEDHRDDLDRLRGALADAMPSTRVDVASETRSALSAIERSRPTVVILDLMLPGESGFQALMAIRDRWPDLPVVVFTSVAELGPRFLCRELGADFYQVKPPSAAGYAAFARFVRDALAERPALAGLRAGSWHDRCGAERADAARLTDSGAVNAS